ncbi:hypothetical protein Nepgr_024698 [Nepenthes gracilis]|uniref:Uncharacterized protein n=1 Tax=Nepenthes gracilis TaxID=150966 RepID=A0AAD3T4M9_NEPGR|nr:hypothetical protein Nepgr_024698 [Nepenthes gracilis]
MPPPPLTRENEKDKEKPAKIWDSEAASQRLMMVIVFMFFLFFMEWNESKLRVLIHSRCNAAFCRFCLTVKLLDRWRKQEDGFAIRASLSDLKDMHSFLQVIRAYHSVLLQACTFLRLLIHSYYMEFCKLKEI